MKISWFNRKNMVVACGAALLAGCQVIPKTDPVIVAPEPTPEPEPSATALPTDTGRHRVALLVPMTGDRASIGQAIANATTMALIDTNSDNLRITTYDTSAGAEAAARKAIADGNKLILGPLLSDSIPGVKSALRRSGVTAISFSNDSTAAGDDVYVMGHIPEQSIRRSVAYARQQGSNSFSALLPRGDYGDNAFKALNNALADFGGNLVSRETYDRGDTSITTAARRLRVQGGYDTVLIADGARLSALAAPEIKRQGAGGTRLIGTELWSGESVLVRAGGLEGSIFSAIADERFQSFSASYETRFGSKPSRVAALGYDAVLLTLRIARDWRVGSNFPESILRQEGGFVGLDGVFRFGRNGVVERAWEVREVGSNRINTVSEAPTTLVTE